MNKVLTRFDSAGHVIRHALLHDNGWASIPQVTAQYASQFRNDCAGDASANHHASTTLHAAANDLFRQALRRWASLDSENAYCDVPATDAGLIAIQQLVSEGINVRATQLFGLRRYLEVLDAYLRGVEARLALGKPVRHVASIAHLSLNSVDELIDPILETVIAQDSEPADLAEEIQGNIASAINTLARQINRETFRSERFQRLAKRGVQAQCLFVDCNHCCPSSLTAKNVEYAQWIVRCLPKLGIDIDAIAQQLEAASVEECAGSAASTMFDMSSYFTSSSQRPLGLMT